MDSVVSVVIPAHNSGPYIAPALDSILAQKYRPPTMALGIDPSPKVDHHWQTPTQVVRMTSSEFFSGHSLAEFFRLETIPNERGAVATWLSGPGGQPA